jgi:hypothetical protein
MSRDPVARELKHHRTFILIKNLLKLFVADITKDYYYRDRREARLAIFY